MKLSIIKLLPDDYHGDPHVASICPPETFPEIPDEDEVFDAWSGAGYNAWSMYDVGDDEENDDGENESGETEKDVFDQYGNNTLYYAIYLVLHENDSDLEMFDPYDISQNNKQLTPEEFSEWLVKEIPGVKSCIPLIKG